MLKTPCTYKVPELALFDVFAINGSNAVKKSSTSWGNHLPVVAILQIWRSCHYLINIYLAHNITYFPDHYREGFLSDPPEVLHVWIIGTRWCRVATNLRQGSKGFMCHVCCFQKRSRTFLNILSYTILEIADDFWKVLWSSFLQPWADNRANWHVFWDATLIFERFDVLWLLFPW